jgi:hypothetical protein
MFIKNKYSKWYYSIIANATTRNLSTSVKTEKHHILPKSIGGNNEQSNLVKLTLREHFICHRLLPKMTTGVARTKMMYAIWKMCHSSGTKKLAFKLNARTYSAIKEMMRSVRKSEDFTPEWRAKLSKSRLGKGTWNKGIGRTNEEKEKMSATRKARSSDPTWNLRPPCSEEKAAKIQKANLGKKWAHHKESLQRKYLSPNDFLSYITNGWEPGLGKF